MIIKLKNGFTVTIHDTEGKSREECLKIAKAAAKEVEDSVKLEKDRNTNVSFSIQRIREATKTKNAPALQKEIDFLLRDIDSDLKHENYRNIYDSETLKKIIDQYKTAISVLRTAEKEVELEDIARDLNTIESDVAKIEDLWKVGKQREFTMVIETDADTDQKKFDDLYDAIQYLDRMGQTLERNGEKINKAYIAESALTGEILYEYSKHSPNRFAKTEDSRKMRDVPYYDPSESPVIRSEISPARLEKEIAHSDLDNPYLDEYDDIIKEIDELVEQGRQALVEAGWNRQDARQAINSRYYKLVKALRKADEKEKARELSARIKKLEKAWDLIR